jgi:hypothetical protein
MTESQILLVDINRLARLTESLSTDQKILEFLQKGWPQHNWKFSIKTFGLAPGGGPSLIYPRAGKNTFPFRNDHITSLNISPPQYKNNFSRTFAEVTDEQCCRWLQEKNDKPWLIFWSGGIDSTVIMVSILKNTTQAQRKNIHVACNRASIYEHPRFFYDHVLPNFKLVPSHVTTCSIFDSYHVISGEFADQLYGHGGMGWELMQSNPEYLNRDLRQSPDALLDMLSKKVDRDFAVWYYERMLVNIDSVDIPVKTYHDFFWWIFFNYSYTSMYLKLIMKWGFDKCSVADYQYPDWYATNDYQQWSMNNNEMGIKYNLGLANNKLASKLYIYDFDHDQYSRLFKTKQTSIQSKPYNSMEICLLDDYSRLRYDQDLDRIMALLPNHVMP